MQANMQAAGISQADVVAATKAVQNAGGAVTGKSVKDMNDVQFLIYTMKQSFVALAVLRAVAEAFGGFPFATTIAALVAIVIATLLRHKSTRKFLPAKIQALWEPLRKIRKSRVLKLKACVLIDVCSFAAFFYPMAIKLVFGKSGWTPVGVFLVHYLFYSFSLAAANFSQIFTSATNFLPTATLGWMIENGFLQRSDLWAAITNPATAKRITKEFFKRLKQFYQEEKERRRLGLTDEDAYERFAVSLSAAAQTTKVKDGKLQGAEYIKGQVNTAKKHVDAAIKGYGT